MRKYLLVALLPLLLAGAASARSDRDSSASGRGWLGVYTDDLSDPLLIALNVSNGVLVTGVAEESPAEKAGLKEGDVIVSVADDLVRSAAELRRVVRRKPGQTVGLQLLRRGESLRLSATLGAREDIELESDIRFRALGLPREALRETRRALKAVGPKLVREIEVTSDGFDELRNEMKELRRQLDSLRLELKQRDQR
jgi:hypothetical protein